MEADDTKYSCSICDYASGFLAEVWKHALDEHPGEKVKLDSKVKEDIIVNLVVEQNVNIMEDMNSLKNGLKNSFNQLAMEIYESERRSRFKDYCC